MFGMLVFTAQKLNKSISKTNCILSTIPLELLEGVNAQNDQFLGLNQIVDVLTSFQEESATLETHLGINFLNIYEEKAFEKAQKILTKIQTFASQHKGISNHRQKGHRSQRKKHKTHCNNKYDRLHHP
jgi:hypothetical protein